MTIEPAATPCHGIGGKTYVGIDNGFTGAMAILPSNGGIFCAPVSVSDLGRERFLNVDGNRRLLLQFLERVEAKPENVLVTYEQSQINPYFGYKSNHTNGKNGEFWRVLLELEKLPYTWVNPKQWQKAVFRAIRGKDTKAMADMVRRQRFPGLDLSGYSASQIEGINDAVCIALYCREQNR